MEYKTNVHEMLMSSRASVLRSKMSAGHLKKILVLQEVRLESEIIDVSQVGVFSLLGDSVSSYSALGMI